VEAGKTIGMQMPVNAVLVGIVHELIEGKTDRSNWRRNIDQLVKWTGT
jgi:hypothetical protein